MPRNNASASVGGMLDDLKSRLGFNRGDGRRDDADYDDYRGDDEYDDYDEFSEYGDDYDDNAPIGGYRPASTSGSQRSSRRFGRADSTPSLVSIDDVKASTPLPDRLQRDPLASTRDSYTPPTASRSGRSLIENTGPAPSSPAHNAAMRDQRTRSEGLDSLFEPSQSDSYDPYEAYSSSNPTSHVASRTLTVIKPTVYGDVERVARAVKSGDVVVLVMRNTPDDLSKRILDFSFGVASALDASVECPGDKVFAIARGNALSEDEKRRLRSQGAL